MNKKIAIDTGKHTTKVVAESKGNTSLHFSHTSAPFSSTISEGVQSYGKYSGNQWT